MKIVFIFILFSSFVSRAENRWLEPEKNTLSTSLGLQSNTLAIEINEKNSNAPKIIYKPNNGNQLYLGLNYGLLSAAFNIDDPPSEKDSKMYGKSTSDDYQFRFYGRRWTPEIFYQNYHGYYIENSAQLALPSTSSSGGAYYRDDISFTHWGANLFYNLNPSYYSISGNFNLSYRQIESGGSWFLVSAYNSYNLRSEAPFIPNQLSGYNESLFYTGIKNEVFSLGFAGAYNLVYNNFFVGGLLGVALNLQNTQIGYVDGRSTSASSQGSRFYLKVGIGYNGPQFYAGATLNNDGQMSAASNSSYIYDTTELKIFIGWRFTEITIESIDDATELINL